MFKIRSSSDRRAGNGFNFSVLEQEAWRHVSQRYATELAITDVWKVKIPPLGNPVEVANLLRHTDMYLVEHTINSASKPWPPPVGGYERAKSRHLNSMLQVLSTFGTLDLHIITVNIEGITRALESVSAIRDYPGIQHVSFYAVMSQKYADLLDFLPEPEDDIDDNSSPLWVRFSLDKLEAELNWLNGFRHMVPELHTNAQR
jgi:hypothetical protein